MSGIDARTRKIMTEYLVDKRGLNDDLEVAAFIKENIHLFTGDISFEEECPLTKLDMEDKSFDIDEQSGCLSSEVSELIRRAPITKLEKTVILLRYGFVFDKGLKQKEIAELFGITASRVQMLEKTALKKIRGTKLIRKLCDYFDNEQAALRYVDDNSFVHTVKSPICHYDDARYLCDELVRFISFIENLDDLDKKIMDLKVIYGPYRNDELAFILGIGQSIVDEVVSMAFKRFEERTGLKLIKK